MPTRRRAKKPDLSFTPAPGEPVEVTLEARARPWHVRLGEVDLFITVGAGAGDEPPIEPEDALDFLDAEGAPE